MRGGPAGDLFIVFHVRDHEFFKRNGLDVYCEVPVPFHIAMLGGEIEVPTLHGGAKLKIPPGTESVPQSGRSTPVANCRSVVFPVPLGPTTPAQPAENSQDTSSNKGVAMEA